MSGAPCCRLATCGKPLTVRPGWEPPEFCGPTCRDAHIDAVMAEATRDRVPKRKGKNKRRHKSCLWCGTDLPPIDGKRFCNKECREAHQADVAAGKKAARDVPAGESWAFREHRTQAEIMADERARAAA